MANFSKRPWFLIVTVILIAACLRSPLTGVGSIIQMIRTDLDLSSSAAGMITTIPLLAFGLLSLQAGLAARKVGTGRVMTAGLLMVIAGILLRSSLETTGLFAGTIIIGIGIAIGNVLLPVVIKANFPTQIGFMTAVYATVQATTSGISGGISAPIASRFGWQIALGIWVLIAGLALVFWLPFRKAHWETAHREGGFQRVIRRRISWALGIYFGLQSMIFYCFVAWFATILQSRGTSLETSAFYNSCFLFMGLAGTFTAPFLSELRSNRSWLGITLGVTYTVGLLFMIFGTGTASIWLVILLCGYCQGAAFSFGVGLFIYHSEDAAEASLVSGFAQSVGYLIAATGPAVSGRLFDLTGSWSPALWLCTGVTFILIFLGFYVGKPRH